MSAGFPLYILRSAWRAHSRTSRSACSVSQFVEQRLGVLQIRGVEALGEPVVDVREYRACFGATAAVAKQSRETDRRAQLPSLGLYVLCERNRLAEVGLGQCGLAKSEPQASATGQSIGP